MYAAVSCRLDIAHAVHSLASDMQAPTGAQHARSEESAAVPGRHQGDRSRVRLAGRWQARLPATPAARQQHAASMCAPTPTRTGPTTRKIASPSPAGWPSSTAIPISWSSKKQRVVALSTCEAELYAEAAAIQEVLWLRDLLAELGLHVQFGSLVYGDNQSTLAVSQNGVKSDRTKHVDVKYHFITQTVEEGAVKLKWIPTAEQQADIFTKALAAAGVRAPEAAAHEPLTAPARHGRGGRPRKTNQGEEGGPRMADAQGGAGLSGLERRRGGATPSRGSESGCTGSEQATELRELLSRDRAADSQADHKTRKMSLAYYVTLCVCRAGRHNVPA